ncbi:putative transcriptional regulator [Roseiarcus fermentans]|uniref:Putative transcriptional regulator n=1 Tax=Roseiarcus fermentans TaxID=1473586 RepID=A0A366FU79_9HYPH|nr:helix-turn-helix domain-containing protein [Roseiarcus fermentans]RBP17716.1 putative transcriptional regulator [Roseiarcus fermentans]
MTEKRDDITKPRGEADADAPLTDDEFDRGYGATLARRARAATGLSQVAFAARYGIPAASLREWEQGRRAPDAATQSYLRVIARMPEAVAKALHDAA